MITRRTVINNRKKWLAALRSGDYQQGNYVLENADHRFCCLGVACVILGVEKDRFSKVAGGGGRLYNLRRIINLFKSEDAS